MKFQLSNQKIISFAIKPEIILTGATIWCNLIFRVTPIYNRSMFYLYLYFSIILFFYIYRKFNFFISLKSNDYSIFFIFFAANLFFNYKYLQLTLSGDELFHSEQSAFIIRQTRKWINSWPELSIEEYRKSFWNLFDLRHMAVIDIWRVISFILLGLITLVWTAYSFVKNKKFYTTIGVVTFIFFLFKAIFRSHTSYSTSHPSLRLFPIFISQLLFGFNNFALRVPGVILSSAVSFFLFYVLSINKPKLPLYWRVIISYSINFIPIVFHVSTIVEPSIYGFTIWTCSLLIAWQYLNNRNTNLLVVLGILGGIGPMFRQTTITIWALISFLYFYEIKSSKKINFFLSAQVFSPILLSLPYFIFIKINNHFLLKTEDSFLANIKNSITSGNLVMTTLNTLTIPWAIFFILCLIFFLKEMNKKEFLLFLMFFPACSVFFNISSFLWGLGRYQAEYIAPFLVLILFYVGLKISERFYKYICIGIILLTGVTLELNANISLDINYSSWPQMRVTTEANLPYQEALGFLKRREALGHFVLVGGQPWYGDASLWLSGHSFTETKTWHNLQESVEEFWKKGTNFKEIYNYLVEMKIDYLILQDGTRREKQHRTAEVQKVLTQIETEHRHSNRMIQKIATFGGEQGGILDIYQVNR